jgi:hypothetical protein
MEWTVWLPVLVVAAPPHPLSLRTQIIGATTTGEPRNGANGGPGRAANQFRRLKDSLSWITAGRPKFL